MSIIDRLNSDRATLRGDSRTMERAAGAIYGIAEVLGSNEVASCVSTRRQLLTALDIVAESLDKRSEFIRAEVTGRDKDFEKLLAAAMEERLTNAAMEVSL